MRDKEALFKNAEYVADRHFAAYFLDSRYMGKQIGAGGEARVYELRQGFTLGSVHADILDPREDIGGSDDAEEYVIKIPRFKSLEKHRGSRKLGHYKRPLELFDEYVVNPSYILERSDGNGYAVLQRRLGHFENVSLENVGLVKDQMEDFFQRHREFVAKGFYIDIVGLEGYKEYLKSLKNPHLSPILTNMVIEHNPEGPKLQVHDVSARNLRHAGDRPAIALFIRRAIFAMERKVLKDKFGYDIGTFNQ
jgi:hypothetical protein